MTTPSTGSRPRPGAAAPGEPDAGGLARLARLTVRRRWAVLLGAALLAMIAGSTGATLFDRLSAGGWYDRDAESGQATEVLAEVFGRGEPNLVLLVDVPAGVDEPTSATTGAALTQALGLERIGRIVTAAAVLISTVFLAFLISDIGLMKAFGVGLPLAVLLDATLIRGAMLPAAMKLLGRATWWAPPPLRRLHARVKMDIYPTSG